MTGGEGGKMFARKKIRYAVVGLGHIAQKAVLPAFKHAKNNSELTALVSGNPLKLKQIAKKYKIKNCYSYDEFEKCLTSGVVDAVYVATPNTLHQKFVEMAATHKIHILCEKPMATDEEACLSMIKAARENKVKLMIAYRLHFEAANLRAIELAASRKIGQLKAFSSLFTFQVTDKNNIRLNRDLGGGTLYDIGIYCINAARYLFRSEPTEVYAISTNSGDQRFAEIDELTSAVLRFPNGELATFTTSFGAADSSFYDLIGTKGRLHLENAYDYAMPMELTIIKDENKKRQRFSKRDQFAPELIYFSNCILKNKEPEPAGAEGLADIRVIQALQRSIEIGQPVSLLPLEKTQRPSSRQEINKPEIKPPKTIQATSPRGDH